MNSKFSLFLDKGGERKGGEVIRKLRLRKYGTCLNVKRIASCLRSSRTSIKSTID